MKSYLDLVIEEELKGCRIDELVQVRQLAREMMLSKTYPYIDRRGSRQRFFVINDRRKGPGPTRRLMIILTACMAAVSTISLVAASIVPEALYNVPIFFGYCAAIILVRAKLLKTSRGIA